MNNQDNLPFGLFEPTSNGKITWICNYDKDRNITSVFKFQDGDEVDKKVGILDNIEQAIECRDELIKDGWKKLEPPKITFSYGRNKETSDMNRKQKRWLAKQAKKTL